LEKLISDENIHPEISKGAKLMSDFIANSASSDEKQLSETLGVDRTRLYRGVSPTYGPPPPYEAVWSTDPAKQNEFLQRIASMYQQDGLALDPDIHERVDYVGIELAYLEQLARDEAKSLKAKNYKMAGTLLERQKTFLVEHLGNWVPKFVEKALEYVQTDFYRGHLLMLRGFILDQGEILSEVTSTS
jgi:TorA maturation chaperone TorD